MRSDLAGWAQYGYCASHSRYFWGLRLHLVCTLSGLPVAFALAGAKAGEQETLLDIFTAEPRLLAERPGQTLIGDKNARRGTAGQRGFHGNWDSFEGRPGASAVNAVGSACRGSSSPGPATRKPACKAGRAATAACSLPSTTTGHAHDAGHLRCADPGGTVHSRALSG
jgi:hypothetical protein